MMKNQFLIEEAIKYKIHDDNKVEIYLLYLHVITRKASLLRVS